MAAPERQIRGGDATVKIRDPLRAALLDAATLGIYGAYWFYAANKELAALGRARGTEELGTRPMNSFLALLPGFVLLLIPFLVSGYRTAERVKAAQRRAGLPETVNSAAVVPMLILFPFALHHLQRGMNEVWAAETV